MHLMKRRKCSGYNDNQIILDEMFSSMRILDTSYQGVKWPGNFPENFGLLDFLKLDMIFS